MEETNAAVEDKDDDCVDVVAAPLPDDDTTGATTTGVVLRFAELATESKISCSIGAH